MGLNRTYFRVDVSETEQDRNYWASRARLSAETIAGIRDAEVVLIPWENRGAEGLTFPTGTTEFYQALVKAMSQAKAAIAVDPEPYAELSLHADETRWPTLFVSTVFFGALANLLSGQIDKAMSSATPPATIELHVIVEKDHGKCISIDYKGPPDRLVDTLVAEAEHCLPPKSQTKTP